MLERMDSALIPRVAHPQDDCAWCWYALHPDEPFPEDRSSTCCGEHGAWQLARVAAARAIRRQGQALMQEVQS